MNKKITVSLLILITLISFFLTIINFRVPSPPSFNADEAAFGYNAYSLLKTGKDEYFNLLETIREMRKQLLGMMIKQTEGEVWCISKHLLAASMRLMEVGTKMQSRKQLDSAKDMFKKSYELFSLFFAIRLKLVDLPDIKRENLDENNLDKPWTKDKIMTELLDCCKE